MSPAVHTAIAQHVAHAAMGCDDPLTDCLISQALACTPRLFQVSITRPDGKADNYLRIGGSSCDHALEAVEIAGAGSVVRVVPLDTAVAA